MNRHLFLILRRIILLLILCLIMILVYDNYLHIQQDLENPNYLGSYSNTGYFTINPETILASLERGDANIFMPLMVNPQDVTKDVTDITISWTQTDFLRIAKALDQIVWDGSIDSEDWNIFYISFGGNCNDTIGFLSATITYFKEEGLTYTTRIIEINPYLGLVGWGDGAIYPKPILQKWDYVNIFEAIFTADDALRIASDDAKERFQLTDNCGVLLSSPQYNDNKNWYVRFIGSPEFVTYIISLDTGRFTIKRESK